MRLSLSSILVVSVFSLQGLAGEAPVISMSSDHLPCPGEHCKQTCNYLADAIIEYQGFEVEGKIKIESKFDNKTDPKKINLRTLVKVEVDLIGEAGLWDETSIIDAETLRMEKTYNFLKVGMGTGEKGLKKAEWSSTQFTWPANYIEVPTATVTAIGGRTVDEIKRKSEKFYQYLKTNTFGNDWMDEFFGENPERKTERDMKDFAENILSPTFVSLFHLRFIPFIEALRYNLFVNYSAPKFELGLLGAFQIGLEGQKSGKDTSVVYQGELTFGDFESQPGKPARIFVDKSTNQYERLEFSLQNQKQGIKATAWTTSVSCSAAH
ncbi:MAG: hypothetical protein A4S09_06635 [Proteobacteria bacterium SG_bin7]|nr:MAG: hypothetical protein A4S09_06635 [Proteobacteria bacterium SG_bin7]